MKVVVNGYIIKESLSGDFYIMVSDDDNMDARHRLRMAMIDFKPIKVTVEDVK